MVPGPSVDARRRGRPRKIDQDKIVAAAIDLGLDAFTMVTVAERLGVSPATLYTHVRGRDEVLALAGTALRSRLATFTSDATTWYGWLTDFAHLVRRDLASSAAAVLGELGSPGMADRVALAEDGLALLIADGFTPTEAGHAVWLVFRLAITAGSPRDPSFGAFVRDSTAVLDTPASSAVPATRAVHDALADGGPHDSFAFDLAVVLDGIALRRTAPMTRPERP